MIELDDESKRLLQEALASVAGYEGAIHVEYTCILTGYDPEYIHGRPRSLSCKLNAEERKELGEGNIDSLMLHYGLNPETIESAELWDITITPA